MNTIKYTIAIVGLLSFCLLAGGVLPMKTEVFQEVSIDDMENLPQGVSNLLSIEVEPVSEQEVRYKINFDSTTLIDSLPLSERYAYQDLGTMHIFDFYNCYSLGAIDGISIRRDPVTAVDKKMYKSSDGAFVLRILFNCTRDAVATVESSRSAIFVTYKAERAVSAAAEAPVVKPKKAEKSSFVNVSKKILVGMGVTAVAGAAATYFVGHNKGEDAGREDAYANPVSKIPPLTEDDVFPDEIP